MDYKIKFGNDNGNSGHKMLLDGKLIQQPNVLAEIYDIPEDESKDLDYLVNNIHDNLVVTVNSISTKGKKSIQGMYFVGARASKSGHICENIDVGAINSKVDSDIILINSNAHVAAHAVRKHYVEVGSLPDKLAVVVDMVTELPVKQYNNKTKNEMAARFMQNYTHEVTVHVKDRAVKVNITYDFVVVTAESVPSIHGLINYDHAKWAEYMGVEPDVLTPLFSELEKEYSGDDEDFKVNPSVFKSARVLHIAPGEGTTEYPLTNGVIFDPDFINGSNNGIGMAIERAIQQFMDQTRLTSFSRQNYSEMIMNPTHRHYQRGIKLLNPQLKPEALAIWRNGRQELANAKNDVDFVLVHGGGSILLRDHLYPQIKEHVDHLNIKLFYVPSQYAVVLESIGLYEFCCSPTFEALKKLYKSSKEQ